MNISNNLALGRRIRLKVSEAEKYADDCQWFKEVANYYVPNFNSVIQDYERMLATYQIVNNDISQYQKYIDKYCSWYGEKLTNAELEELLPYNRLYTKKNILRGELLGRNEEYQAILLSKGIMQRKNELLREALEAAVDEELNLAMETAGMAEDEKKEYIKQNKTQPEPKEVVKKDFKTEWELFYNHAIKYCHYSQEVKSKRMESFDDVIIADRTIIYVGIENGEPTIKVKNPLHIGFFKSTDEKYIHKSECVWSRDTITLSKAIELYDLTEEQVEELYSSAGGSSFKSHNVIGGTAKPVRDNNSIDEWESILSANNRGYYDKNIGTHQTQGLSTQGHRRGLLRRLHFEFKAFRKVYFRLYKDDYNELASEVLTEDFKIPKEATKSKVKTFDGQEFTAYIYTDEMTGIEYTIEEHWIPRKYELERIENLVVNCREVPYQSFNAHSPISSFELSYKGAIFTDRNANSVSIAERAIPYLFQYFFVKTIQNKELAKYKSFIQSVDVDQIPMGLGEDADGNVVQDHIAAYLEFLRQTHISLYSGSQTTTGGLPQSTRSIASNVQVLGTASELLNLQQLLTMIDMEISMAMGISPQRAMQSMNNTNVTDNQQEMAQSQHSTEVYTFLLDEIWKKVIDEWLKLFIIFLREKFEKGYSEHYLFYITPEGSRTMFKITPDHVTHHDIGIWVDSSNQERLYHQTMLQLVHAFGQNGGEGMEVISSIIRSISNGVSSSEIHNQIVTEQTKQQDRLKAMEQMKGEQQMELMKKQQEQVQLMHQLELEKIKLTELLRKDTIIAKAEIDATRFAQAEDINDNNEPDKLEVEKLRVKSDFEKEKLRLMQSQHNDKMALEYKKLNKQSK